MSIHKQKMEHMFSRFFWYLSKNVLFFLFSLYLFYYTLVVLWFIVILFQLYFQTFCGCNMGCFSFSASPLWVKMSLKMVSFLESVLSKHYSPNKDLFVFLKSRFFELASSIKIFLETDAFSFDESLLTLALFNTFPPKNYFSEILFLFFSFRESALNKKA